MKIDSQPQKGYDSSVQQLLLPIWTPNDAVLSLLRYIPRCMQQLTMNNIWKFHLEILGKIREKYGNSKGHELFHISFRGTVQPNCLRNLNLIPSLQVLHLNFIYSEKATQMFVAFSEILNFTTQSSFVIVTDSNFFCIGSLCGHHNVCLTGFLLRVYLSSFLLRGFLQMHL